MISGTTWSHNVLEEIYQKSYQLEEATQSSQFETSDIQTMDAYKIVKQTTVM